MYCFSISISRGHVWRGKSVSGLNAWTIGVSAVQRANVSVKLVSHTAAYVCVCVCLSVCLGVSVCVRKRERISKQRSMMALLLVLHAQTFNNVV